MRRHSLSTTTSGLGMLSPNSESPVVTETSVHTHLLQPFQVLAKSSLKTVRADVLSLTSFVVLLPVKEPVRDSVVLGGLDDVDNLFNLLVAELSSTNGSINLSALAYNVSKAASDSGDGRKGIDNVHFSIDIRIENTKDVLKIGVLQYDRL